MPTKALLIIVLTLLTAFLTPLPKYLPSLSLNSIAYLLPVEAPDGTDAIPLNPLSVVTSTSTVGKILESYISLALILAILLMIFPPNIYNNIILFFF